MDGVFLLSSQVGDFSAEAIVYANLASFMSERIEFVDGTFEHHQMADRDVVDQAGSPPGAYHFKAEVKVLSAGGRAFLELSDFYKNAVFFDNVPVEFGRGGELGDNLQDRSADVNWSSLNSRHIVTLTKNSWQLSQFLPCASRSFYPCPPILLPFETQPDPRQISTIMVIMHTGDLENCKSSR